MQPTRRAHLASLLLRAYEAMSSEVAEELAARGHPGATPVHHSAMEAIEHGAADASALGRVLGISRQAAAKTIRSLEQLGYIERGTDEADARRRPLRVTDRGRERTALGAAAYQQILVRLEAREGAARLGDFERFLHLIPEVTRTPERPAET